MFLWLPVGLQHRVVKKKETAAHNKHSYGGLARKFGEFIAGVAWRDVLGVRNRTWTNGVVCVSRCESGDTRISQAREDLATCKPFGARLDSDVPLQLMMIAQTVGDADPETVSF